MMPVRYPTENELSAFIDDELSPSRRDEVAGVLREDPVLATRVAAYEADREQLRLALGGVAEEPLPAAWAALIDAAMAPRINAPMALRPKTVMTRRFALAASVVLVASAAALVRSRWPREETILTEADAARDGHLNGRMAEGDPLPPPVTRDALLNSTLGMHVRAPDLDRFGFRLTRMELFSRPEGGAAQLRYSDAGRRDLTIYVRPSDGTVRFDILRRGEIHVCVWQDDVVGAVITAPVSAPEMMRIASSAYVALNL